MIRGKRFDAAAGIAGSTGIVGVLVGVLAGCSGSSGGACSEPTGTYELTVAPTGQSENQAGAGVCPGDTSPSTVVDLTFTAGVVTLGDETCTLCASDGCEMRVTCGQTVDCSGGTVPVTAPPATYVQNVTFVLPTGSTTQTSNAEVEFGPSFCGFEGTAVRKD